MIPIHYRQHIRLWWTALIYYVQQKIVGVRTNWILLTFLDNTFHKIYGRGQANVTYMTVYMISDINLYEKLSAVRMQILTLHSHPLD